MRVGAWRAAHLAATRSTLAKTQVDAERHSRLTGDGAAPYRKTSTETLLTITHITHVVHCTTHHRNRVVPVVISRRQKGQRSICPVLMHVPQSMWPQTLITMSFLRSMHTWHVVDRLDASSSLFAFDASNERSSRSCLY